MLHSYVTILEQFFSYKFELDPNNVTITLLRKHVGARRFVWNWALAKRKLCSHCGHKHEKLKLSDREWVCKACGTHHDRDINAAKNLFKQIETFNVPMSCRDRGIPFKKGKSKKSVEKPLMGVQFNELSNVICEAENERLNYM
jgi:transposase